MDTFFADGGEHDGVPLTALDFPLMGPCGCQPTPDRILE